MYYSYQVLDYNSLHLKSGWIRC